MTDFQEIWEYFRRLPRSRFDQASFKLYISTLTDYVNRFGMSDRDIAMFFTLWLNLNIPLPKWLSIGRCMVPEARIPETLVDEAMKWVMRNYQQDKVTRVNFLFSWLSGLMEYNLVDEDALDKYYDIFLFLLDQDKYRSHVVKLVCHFTKTEDINRWTVLQVLNLTKKPMNAKSLNELYVVLRYYKSLRPDLVPENVPLKSAQSVFTKLHPELAQRFAGAQQRSCLQMLPYKRCLSWTVSAYLEISSKGAKDLPIIPDIERVSAGDENRGCIDFRSVPDLLQYYLQQDVTLPPSLLTLLSNAGGMQIIAFTESQNQRVFSNSVYFTLAQCFLNKGSSHSMAEKIDFLERIYTLECVLLQGIPIVSQFLFEYLITWNGCDYFKQVMDLLQWAVFSELHELENYLFSPIETLFCSEDVYYRCSLLKMLTKLYSNIHFASTKTHNLFLAKNIKCNYTEVLAAICKFIDKLCRVSFVSYPNSAILQLSFLEFYATATQLQLSGAPTIWSVVPKMFAYTALCSPSCLMIDAVIALLIKYRSVYKRVKPSMDAKDLRNRSQLIEAYKEDFKNCLWFDTALRYRDDGLLFKKLSEKSVDELIDHFNFANASFNISSHMAFASNTYINCFVRTIDQNYVEKESWLKDAFYERCPNVAEFIRLVDGGDGTFKLQKLLHRRLSG